MSFLRYTADDCLNEQVNFAGFLLNFLISTFKNKGEPCTQILPKKCHQLSSRFAQWDFLVKFQSKTELLQLPHFQINNELKYHSIYE